MAYWGGGWLMNGDNGEDGDDLSLLVVSMYTSTTMVDNDYTGRIVILDAALSICTDRKPDLAFFALQINRLHFSSKLWISKPKHLAAKFLAEQYDRNGVMVWDLYDRWLANFRID